jgi:tRNA nucleotidyltransferase (CCA-adding enzyme)
MQIILTHEQADFDALASMLGAQLLDERAVPVLPRRINRNASAFLTLYGRDLPFIEVGDLPPGPVEAVTLVDTQSMVTLKGMSASTRVVVVDHHPPREDLPESWKVRTEALGATTTAFVEAVIDQGCVLNTVQATLLLLGIYEDTGSLTYARTTARDARAVAFLLERGASLEITVGFLRHPLTLKQQQLYNQLRESAESYLIKGYQVIITCGDAQEMDEEVSTIAHKLRDLLEPDALFMLVTTRGGVQLVARSTSDRIDVGVIAARFNGGGHDRAAAALIREEDMAGVDRPGPLIDSAKGALLSSLTDHIRPAVTVAQIMSREPQVIPPETPASQVALRMQRHGYEGYPVVDSGRVVGLITRRAVDRALAHRLDKTAASLMMAGEVTVHPDDSIEQLQNLMIETGWGQIPVVDPDTGKITGIVTRTDLIQTLAPSPALPGVEHLGGRLEKSLPPARQALIRAVAEEAGRQGAALYLVGGFVRDLILGHPGLDFDLVVEGDAIKLARALAKEYGGRVTSHTRFGTAKWHIQKARDAVARRLEAASAADAGLQADELPATLDFVSARTEFYTHPTALPTVERGSIKLDLHRRDFTINTLAVRLDGAHYGELYDYWGGLLDLRQGEVRVLHSLSFIDDPTRMLRAVRFEVRFSFAIESRTLELLREARPLLAKVSGDRIRHELDSTLDEEGAPQMLSRLDELELLSAIHPDLEAGDWIYAQVGNIPKLDPAPYWDAAGASRETPWRRALAYILWMLRLEPARVRQAARRLKLRAALAEACTAASKLRADLPELVGQPPSRIVARLDGLPLHAIYANYLASNDAPARAVLESYASTWRNVYPVTNGSDLRALGLPPGPAYRRILSELRNAWLDGGVESSLEEKRMLDGLLAGLHGSEAGDGKP